MPGRLRTRLGFARKHDASQPGMRMKSQLFYLVAFISCGVAAGGFAQSRAAATPSRNSSEYVFLVFSNPASGMDEAYREWYDDRHLPDVVSVPGFVSARRFQLADVQMRRLDRPVPRFLALYHVRTTDLVAVREAMSRKARCGAIRTSAAMGPDVQMYTFKLTGRAQAGTREPARVGQQDYIHVVLGDATKGQDAAFNRWYDRVHEPQLLHVPGFIEGQRGISGGTPLAPQYGTSRYVALFRLRTADLQAMFARTKTLDVPPPSFDRARTFGYTFRAIGPELSGDAVRKERKGRAPDVLCNQQP